MVIRWNCIFEATKFLSILKSIQIENTFNPYTDICELHDVIDANRIRQRNLLKYLHIVKKSSSILVGEAPGYLGCRRTGLAFTDNRHLPVVQNIYDLDEFEIATKSGKDKENSALFMWRVIGKLDNPPFVWNIIPLHPHKKANPMSNRTPVKQDYTESKQAIEYLLGNVEFGKIIAIGRVAEKHLINMGFDCEYVRHPSQGGSTIFTKQIMNILSH